MQEFTATGKYLAQTVGEGAPRYPWSCAFDARGMLNVCDASGTIRTYSPDLLFQGSWPPYGVLTRPRFIAYDPAGAAYVTQWGPTWVAKLGGADAVPTQWDKAGGKSFLQATGVA